MTEWVRGFIIPQVAEAHALYARAITQATFIEYLYRGTPLAGPAAATLSQLRRSYVQFNDNLGAVAAEGAVQATKDIRARLAQTASRADTRTSPHLRDLIYCAPLPVGALQTGWVGVGRVSNLNQAVNHNTPGYGPYWRAQEYGTGSSEVPSQIGRILFGVFVGPGGGNPTPPRSEYAGGRGPHPIFLSGPRSGRGSARSVLGYMSRIDAMPSRMAGALGSGNSGFGTIGHEIAPRRFIGIGADAAAVRWHNQVAAIQQRAVDELAAITAP